ncbi:MAG: extracellular solute-binding protein, partial [Pirellulaceae bacterium]|nr:extracellular solute-binding protein [Pirellulaceae bacterium]
MSPFSSSRIGLFVLILGVSCLPGCGGCKSNPPAGDGAQTAANNGDVVVYCSLDSEFSEAVLDEYEQKSGARVLSNFDIESTKSVGLYNKIVAERSRPRCDVFWNNEILLALRLEQQGLLDAYISPAAEDFPDAYRSPQGHWHGLAARARVLLVNTKRMPDPAAWPTSIRDLADAKHQGRCGVAKPLFGTTASHAAVLFSEWGSTRAKEYWLGVKKNARVVGGNKQVALAVGSGQLDFGLTDTDDAIIELENGQPVAIVFPDQEEGGLGALFIPNTLCIIKGGPNPAGARKLVDYLLQPKIETQLAEGSSAQIPLNSKVKTTSRALPDEPIKWMTADFSKAAAGWR